MIFSYKYVPYFGRRINKALHLPNPENILQASLQGESRDWWILSFAGDADWDLLWSQRHSGGQWLITDQHDGAQAFDENT